MCVCYMARVYVKKKHIESMYANVWHIDWDMQERVVMKEARSSLHNFITSRAFNKAILSVSDTKIPSRQM